MTSLVPSTDATVLASVALAVAVVELPVPLERDHLDGDVGVAGGLHHVGLHDRGVVEEHGDDQHRRDGVEELHRQVVAGLHRQLVAALAVAHDAPEDQAPDEARPTTSAAMHEAIHRSYIRRASGVMPPCGQPKPPNAAPTSQPVSRTSSAAPPKPSPARRPTRRPRRAPAPGDALRRTAVGRTSELLATTWSCLPSAPRCLPRSGRLRRAEPPHQRQRRHRRSQITRP